MMKTDISTLPIAYGDDEVDLLDIQGDSDSDSDDFTQKKLDRLLFNEKIEEKVFNFETRKRDYILVCDSSARNTTKHPMVNSYHLPLETPYYNVIGLELIKASIPQSEFTIDARNCFIDWSERDSQTGRYSRTYSAQLPHGDYTIDNLLTTLQSVMTGTTSLPIISGTDSEYGQTDYNGNKSIFQISLDTNHFVNQHREIITIKFSQNNYYTAEFKSDGFKLLFGSGPNKTKSIAKVLGFNYEDTEYTSGFSSKKLFLVSNTSSNYLEGGELEDVYVGKTITDSNNLLNTVVTSIGNSTKPVALIDNDQLTRLTQLNNSLGQGDLYVFNKVVRYNLRSSIIVTQHPESGYYDVYMFGSFGNVTKDTTVMSFRSAVSSTRYSSKLQNVYTHSTGMQVLRLQADDGVKASIVENVSHSRKMQKIDTKFYLQQYTGSVNVAGNFTHIPIEEDGVTTNRYRDLEIYGTFVEQAIANNTNPSIGAIASIRITIDGQLHVLYGLVQSIGATWYTIRYDNVTYPSDSTFSTLLGKLNVEYSCYFTNIHTHVLSTVLKESITIGNDVFQIPTSLYGNFDRPSDYASWESVPHVVELTHPVNGNKVHSKVKYIFGLEGDVFNTYLDGIIRLEDNYSMRSPEANAVSRGFGPYAPNILFTGSCESTGNVTQVTTYIDKNQNNENYLYGSFSTDDNRKLAQRVGTDFFFDLNISTVSLKTAQLENSFQLSTVRTSAGTAVGDTLGLSLKLYDERIIKAPNRYNLSKSQNVIIKIDEIYAQQRGPLCSYFFNQEFVPPPTRTFNPITRLRALTISMLRSGRIINHEGDLEVNTEGDFYDFNGKDYILVFNITCLERVENKLKPKIVHS